MPKLPLSRCDQDGNLFVDNDDDYDHPNETTPPFDACHSGFVGPVDMHEARRWAREPDSSLNGLKEHVDPGVIDDLHVYFLGVYEKHHGF